MKSKFVFLALTLATIALTLPSYAQTNTPVVPTDPVSFGETALNNVDTNVDYFTSAKMELRIGAVSQGVTGSTFTSVLAASYNVSSVFGVAGDIRNGGQTTSSIQSAHLFGELRHTMGNVEFTGYGGPGWRWDNSAFEGIIGGRIGYIPSPVGAQKWFVWTGPEASMRANNAKASPVVQILAGFGYAFK